MPRVLLALLVLSLALSFPVASSGSGGRAENATGVTTGVAEKIVLFGRRSSVGPWQRYLWLKLDRTDVTSFSVCAVWNRASPPPPTCRAAGGSRLPPATTMRLEQRRARSELRRASSPGWRTVATSPEPALEAVLSNTVSGNRVGSVSYRVTLRNASGRVLGTSNLFRVFWTR